MPKSWLLIFIVAYFAEHSIEKVMRRTPANQWCACHPDYRQYRLRDREDHPVRPTWLKPTAFLSLLLLLAPFFVLEFIYPRFPDSDHEISFKSPGRNMSQGGPFASPELEGFEGLHLNPPIERVYFIYPPLYSWLFGEWTRATGFGWAACVSYDALISAALAL